MLLILSKDVPTCGSLAKHCFVGQSEYWGVGGCSGAVSTYGSANVLHGTGGGAAGGNIAGQLSADWPGLGGLVGGWASLTKSSPNESDSLSNSGSWWSLKDARSDCVSIISITGNQVSLNFTSWEILKHWWAASQNMYPLDPSSYLTKIISQLFGLSLCLSVLWSAHFIGVTLYVCNLAFTTYIPKLLGKPVWCHMDSAPFMMVCWNLSACPFFCGESGYLIFNSIPSHICLLFIWQELSSLIKLPAF